MNESNKTYYYASADGQVTGPVSKQELRKLLEQHIIHESANVIRKGDAQWRRLSDILPPQAADQPAPSVAENMNESGRAYYYASADGQATGPVSAQDRVAVRPIGERVLEKCGALIGRAEADDRYVGRSEQCTLR